jgi:hypothetical protein
MLEEGNILPSSDLWLFISGSFDGSIKAGDIFLLLNQLSMERVNIVTNFHNCNMIRAILLPQNLLNIRKCDAKYFYHFIKGKI